MSSRAYYRRRVAVDRIVVEDAQVATGSHLIPEPARQLAQRPAVLGLVYAIPLGAYALLVGLAWLMSPSASAWVGTWPTLQGLVVVPSIVAGIGLGIVAYRRAGPDARRQLRWVLIGAGLATFVSLVVMYVPQLVLGRPLVSWNLIGLIALPLPIGLAVAIARHGLFDIEIVINRTLVYGGVTLAIVLVYASTVLVLGAIVPQGADLPGSLLATGLAAVAALPARDLLQRTVNRLMYGDRDDPYRALARLSRRLESTLEPMAIPEAIVESVAEALRLPYVALEIGPPGVVELSASRGEPVEQPLRLSLVYGAEPVGRLLFAPRAPGEALTASDTRLLNDLARGAGAAVHSVRLTLDVIRSRERLVAAREEERRRIRRDLHDGLGPTLAAIGMRAELVADGAARDTPAAEELRELTGDVRGALAEVRRLVEGLRPPALDELGLVGAISQQAERLGRPPAFEISSDERLPELPAAIEVAAYRIAVEAMTNAARHAAADHCRVTVTVDRTGLPALRMEITDDGQGLPEQPRPGIGLASMRERTAEVGGSLSIGPAPTGGTRVGALLPLQAAGTR
jgi:signal transduction histidine kinase